MEFKPHIGKSVIETLTMGMYDNPLIIYREYIQNAADQIDVAFEEKIFKKKSEGKISITINKSAKSIEVEDNATGVSSDKVLAFLGDVANSEKEPGTRKGFRGIGRLGGLGYCEKLIFTTSAKGESKQTVMTLDAALLRKILLNGKRDMDAASVISIITDLSTKKEVTDRHYFRVTMQNVTNPVLTDISLVTDFLKMVAPVPFDPNFSFAKDIKKHFATNNIIFEEYNIEINSVKLYKGYKDEVNDENGLSTIVDVEYFSVRSNNKILLGMGWVGYRDLSNYIFGDTVLERGVRLRQHNIQIGSNLTLNKFFPQTRTNQRFIGELHVLGEGFVPNARRDYFIDNSTCSNFEKILTEVLKSENYENAIAHSASLISTRVATIARYNEEREELSKRAGKFKSQAEENAIKDKVNESKSKAEKAAKELAKVKEKSGKDRRVGVLYTKLTENKSLDVPGFELAPTIYKPPKFAKLSPSEVKLVMTIFGIIEKELHLDDSENLKRKIIEKFN